MPSTDFLVDKFFFMAILPTRRLTMEKEFCKNTSPIPSKNLSPDFEGI
jgi:hypothetical protein